MKTYKKPSFNVEILSDNNEPVFMLCSGEQYFPTNMLGVTFLDQVPQVGRTDTRFHAEGHFVGPTGFSRAGLVYCYLKFPEPNISVTQVDSWHQEATWQADGCTYWVGYIDTTMNAGDNPPESGNKIGFSALNAYNTLDPHALVAVPEITFAFEYNAGQSCI